MRTNSRSARWSMCCRCPAGRVSLQAAYHSRMSAVDLQIERITPVQALARQQRGAVLIDVRENDELAAGKPAGAIGIPLATIAAQIASVAPANDADIILSCASGQRSLRAAATLQAAGYTHVASIDGGYKRWLAEGLPVDAGLLDADASERYSRHLLLPEVGVAGQA